MISEDFFLSLITSEHLDKPRFLSTVSASVAPFVSSISTLMSAPTLYDIDVAEGSQLDAVALWVGASRRVALPVDPYFSWDTPSLGWEQGIWWEIGDPLTEVTFLSDADLRSLIRMKIQANIWKGDYAGLMRILYAALPNDAVVNVEDENMSLRITIKSEISTIMQSVISTQIISLAPFGVSASILFLPNDYTQGDFGGDII